MRNWDSQFKIEIENWNRKLNKIDTWNLILELKIAMGHRNWKLNCKEKCA